MGSPVRIVPCLLVLLLLTITLAPSSAAGRSSPGAVAGPAPPQPDTTLLTGSYGRILADPSRDRMYFSRPAWGTVLVWNTTSNTRLANVSVGPGPYAMDFSWSGDELYVGLTGASALAVVNLNTLTLVKTIPLGVTPVDVAGGRPGRAYVTTSEGWGYPRIVDTDLGDVLGSITAAGLIYQDALARTTLDRSILFVAETGLSPAGLYAFNVTTDSVTLIGSPPFGSVGENLMDFAVSPVKPWLLIASGWPYYVQVVDYLNWSSVDSLSTGPYPSSVGLAQRGALAVADHESSDVIAFNTTTGSTRGTFTFSQQVMTVRVSRDGTALYAITSDGMGGNLQVERLATGFPAVSSEPPIARAFADPAFGYVTTPFTFSGRAVFGTAPYTFAWDFGDGTTGSGATVVHSFSATGLHNVTLRVKDAKSAFATSSTSVFILVPPLPGVLSVGPTVVGDVFANPSNPYVPPDTQVAVGPDRIVEMVNLRMMVWTRDEVRVRDLPLSTFFQRPVGDFLSDPRIEFDAPTGRWFASILDVTLGSALLDVSAGTDPAGAWTQTPLASSGCPDQPMLGVGPDTVVVSANVFTSCTSTGAYAGAEYWIVNKTDLLAGRTPSIRDSGILAGRESLHPVDVLDSAGTMYLVSVGWAVAPTNTLQVIPLLGAPPNAATAPEMDLPVRTVNEPPNVPQRGTSFLVNTGDARVLDAVERNGQLWITFGDACSPAGPYSNQSCARVLQIDPANRTVVQDFDVGDGARGFFYPALRFDGSGDLVVAFGYASSSDYPGLMVATQLPGDPRNATRAPEIVRVGTGPEDLYCPDGTSCRYGDYSGASADPADPEAVWVAGEIGGPSGWQTTVASVGIFTPANVTVRYTLAGAPGAAGSPTVSLVYEGKRYTVTLTPYNVTYPADPGTAWSAPAFVTTADSRVRWEATGPTSGLVLGPETVSIPYQTQFYVGIVSAQPDVGNVSPASGWYASGATLHLNASAAPGWLFAGWTGSGNGSVSGSSPVLDALVAGPITETADFRPGLTLVAGPGGDIEYHYAGGSGVVPAGTRRTLSVPRSTLVSLNVLPAPGWRFASWNGAGPTSVSGSYPALNLVVSDPLVEAATFDPGITLAATGGGVLAYRYGNVSGLIGPGTNATLYVPLGTELDLVALPASGDVFTGWTGNASGANASAIVIVSGPSRVSAAFGPPPNPGLPSNGFPLVVAMAIVLAVLVLAVIVLAVIVLLQRRPRGGAPPPTPAPEDSRSGKP